MAGNIADSLELLHQCIYKDHDVAHAYIDHPYDWGKINYPYVGLPTMGKFYNPWTNLTDNQFGFFRLTADGRLMVDTEMTLDGANIFVNNIEIGSTDGATLNAGIRVDADWHPQVDILTMPPVVVVPGGYTNKFYWEGTASNVDTVLAFGFDAEEVTIFNDGINTLHYEHSAVPVSPTSPRMEGGEAFVDDFVANNIHLITLGLGLTTAVRVWARG